MANTKHTELEQEPTPTPWHTLTVQESGMARTHTDLIIRLVCKVFGIDRPDTRAMIAEKVQLLREDIEEETRNLLYIERGAAIASWMMEAAIKTGRIPGHDGDLSNVEPATHERMQLAMDQPGHHSLGPKPVEGIPATQEPKFTIKGGRLVNRQSGKPIPADEPIFILRARDRHAVHAIMDYLFRVEVVEHHRAVSVRLKQFEDFRNNHPDRMHEPDTTVTEDWPGACHPKAPHQCHPPACMTAGQLRALIHPVSDTAGVMIERPDGELVPMAAVDAEAIEDLLILRGSDRTPKR